MAKDYEGSIRKIVHADPKPFPYKLLKAQQLTITQMKNRLKKPKNGSILARSKTLSSQIKKYFLLNNRLTNKTTAF